ncbi:B12-binding domain-containing radical SAM protein [bacterium]|nr:B12-binding domain-containing radical SAM protein [bacterium]
MNILMVYPRYPDTFWSFKHALKFINKKASFPPLGLLTIASFLPKEWNVKLVDLNVENLNDKDIEDADYIFISAMLIQKNSVDMVIEKTKKFNKKIIAGGPLFTTGYENYQFVDSIVVGEGELVMPYLIEDMKSGSLKHIYESEGKPDLKLVPVPRWDLIDIKHYASMAIQYSRGCPFNCEFCDIIILNGRIPRTKTPEQMIDELNALYNIKWRGSVFIVDDNFIGNKKNVKEMLKYLIEWQKERNYPFSLFTECSINLVDDKELMDLMIEANFNKIFIGIETPEEESLKEINKVQNINRNLIDSIKTLQKKGFEVMGGFIVGFDNDNILTFSKMMNFIQKSGIVTAMVGLLNVLPKTKLFERLKNENRILTISRGNNTDFTINFIPKNIKKEELLNGYRQLIKDIYSYKYFYERLWNFIKNYNPKEKHKVNFKEVVYGAKAFFSSVYKLGIIESSRFYYWKTFFKTIFLKPKALVSEITLTIYGYHFKKLYEENEKRLRAGLEI